MYAFMEKPQSGNGKLRDNRSGQRHMAWKREDRVPAQLKTRIDDSAGVSLNCVRVNYNSKKPAKLKVPAYNKEDQAGKNVEILQRMKDHIVQRNPKGKRTNLPIISQQAQQVQQNVLAQIQSGQYPLVLDGQIIVGLYGDIGGHHIHSKSCFSGNTRYNRNEAFSISDHGLNRMGTPHENITKNQSALYRGWSNHPIANLNIGQNNPFWPYSIIEMTALKGAGMDFRIANYLISMSETLLRAQNVAPDRMPYT